MTTLVSDYGYAATFVGVLVEGESFLVLSGAASRSGYLDPAVLVGLGAMGAMLTDNLFFALGRWFGTARLVGSPRLAAAATRLHGVVARYPHAAVFIARFLYGTRTVGPVLIGAGTLSWARYVALDSAAALTWSGVWVAGGYGLGEALSQIWGAVR